MKIKFYWIGFVAILHYKKDNKIRNVIIETIQKLNTWNKNIEEKRKILKKIPSCLIHRHHRSTSKRVGRTENILK